MLHKERIFEKKEKETGIKKKNLKKKREEKISLRLFWTNFEEKAPLVIYACSNTQWLCSSISVNSFALSDMKSCSS